MKYSPELTALIADLIAQGEHNVADICAQAEISRTTFFAWKVEKPDFSDSLKKAEALRREALRLKAASGLSKLLDVHELTEETIEWVDKNGKPTIKSKKVTTRKIMPNTAAIIYTLNNTDPENFQQRKTLEIKPAPGAATANLRLLSDEDLDTYLRLVALVQPLTLIEPASNDADTSAQLAS